jgi:hypothetical protein
MKAFTAASSRAKGIVIAFAILALGFMTFSLGAVGDTNPGCTTGAYGGRAFGIWAHVPLVGDTTLADTGYLPPDGGALDATMFWEETPGVSVAQTSLFFSLTTGINGTAESFASTDRITLSPGNAPLVVASFVAAHSVATPTTVSGDSEVDDLRVMGTPVTVTGYPNQAIYYPGVLTLVINEQIVSTSPSKSITVNALHLWAQGVEIVVDSAYSKITCSTSTPVLSVSPVMQALSVSPPMQAQWVNPPLDFVTGGGFIFVNAAGDHGSFGFVAGYKPNQPLRGELNYIDHSNENHFKATSVDLYTADTHSPPNPRTRIFSGTMTINGAGNFRYTCTVSDNSEPGNTNARSPNPDFFRLDVSNGYSAGGLLVGGNIQLHTRPPS